MTILYQLSRESCPPCQRLKEKILNLKDPKFEYKYIDVDRITSGTMEHDILMDARKNRLLSLPIVGVTELDDNVEILKFTINIQDKNIDEFLDIIQ